MGSLESSESSGLSPPPPSRSTVFVVRNGRYEPQNLMPILPRSDMLDFDGFVVRRGTGQVNARPPDMKQASLLKNPLSVRRDSVKIVVEGIAGAAPSTTDEAVAEPPSHVEANSPAITFTFDANRPGTLKVFLMVTEVEQPLENEKKEEGENEEADKKKKRKGPSSIKLVPREGGDSGLPAAFETLRIEKGLGQVYQSLPIDLNRFPANQLSFDPKRARDVPIAVLLEADVELGDPPSIQYTYITLQNVASSSPKRGDETISRPPQWSANIYSQKLQYGAQCFVLHEVFGVCSKLSHEAEQGGGNSDCVICLSEPRDTAVLPCRHMCFCSYCAGIVRRQCDRCPVCRQKVQSLLTFKRDQDGQVVDDPLAGRKSIEVGLDIAATTTTAVGASTSMPATSAFVETAGTTIVSANSSVPMSAALMP